MDFMTFDFMDFYLNFHFICEERVGEAAGLFLGSCFRFLELLFDGGGEIDDLTTIVIAAFHADGVALVLRATMAAL